MLKQLYDGKHSITVAKYYHVNIEILSNLLLASSSKHLAQSTALQSH